MIPYILLLTFFGIGAIASRPNELQLAGASPGRSEPTQFRLVFLVGMIGMIIMIGLRYHVGGDWANYQDMYDRFRGLSFQSSLKLVDPGYATVNWLCHQAGARVWLVNVICGVIFGWGLFRFCSVQPSPWLAAVVAIPYMVIVVAMGYTRQAVALAFLMAGLARQIRGAPTLNFGFYAIFAALFHKTAIVGFPLIAASGRGNRAINLLIVLSASVLLYDFFLSDSLDGYIESYITTKYSSQGALIRVAMNAFAAALLWFYRKRLGYSDAEWKIWRNFAVASIISLVALAMVSSSTAVDRVSLYLLPLQISVLTRVGLLGTSRTLGTVLVLSYAALVELVWLNFAQFASYWVPYQLYPLGPTY